MHINEHVTVGHNSAPSSAARYVPFCHLCPYPIDTPVFSAGIRRHGLRAVHQAPQPSKVRSARAASSSTSHPSQLACLWMRCLQRWHHSGTGIFYSLTQCMIKWEWQTRYRNPDSGHMSYMIRSRLQTQVYFLMLTMLPLLPADCIHLRELGYAIRSGGPLTQVMYGYVINTHSNK